MAHANVPEGIRYRIYSEAFMTATLLDGLIPIEIDGIIKPCVEHWSGGIPAYVQHLCTWGEAGTVTIKTIMTPKVKDRGVQCMFVGYAIKHNFSVLKWGREKKMKKKMILKTLQ